MKLKDKVAVITGGNSGIGLATAKLFAEEGAKIAITGRNPVTIENATSEIGHEAIGIQADVADISSLEPMFEKVVTKFGKLDILIVNAGVVSLAPLAAVTEEEFDKVTAINYKG